MKIDDNQLEKIDYLYQKSAIKDLDRAGEVALRPLNMKRQTHLDIMALY